MHMSNESLLVILVVGVVAGWLAGKIVQGSGFGIIGDLIIGIIGAFIGGWLLPQLGIHLGDGIVSAIINATIGAVLLLFVLKLLRGRICALPANVKLPHMGWNQLDRRNDSKLLAGIAPDAHFYFAHSYAACRGAGRAFRKALGIMAGHGRKPPEGEVDACNRRLLGDFGHGEAQAIVATGSHRDGDVDR